VNAQPAEVPRRIGRFRIRAVLGQGAFGTVYRAYDPHLEREVAVKVPRPGTLNSPQRIERFLGDARSAARLRHPSIVPVFDAGEEGGVYFIATAYVEGCTLADALDSRTLALRAGVAIVRALAEALAYAHAQGIVHRDVKPDNIMLDRQGQPHLIDFGLARRPDTAEAFSGDGPAIPWIKDARRTQVGAVLGTPAYMSPEQAAGHGGEARATFDQYSLGVILYELLTGQTPFSGPLPIVLFNVANTPPPRPRTVRPAIPLDLEAICVKAMAREGENRYPTCRHLADDLRRWLDGEPVSVRPRSAGVRFGNWL
jgi:serine/threonine protein kinase